MATSPCEIFDCSNCNHFLNRECLGCNKENTRLKEIGSIVCGIYTCANNQNSGKCSCCGHASCGYARRTDAINPVRRRFENQRWWAGKIAKQLADRRTVANTLDIEGISARTIERLRWYLVALDTYLSQGTTSISSWQLSQLVGVKPPLIRKDLSRFGEFGTPSFGYDVDFLRRKIMDALGLNESRSIIWLGVKKLREQFDALQRMSQHNCHLVAVFDNDSSVINQDVLGARVSNLSDLPQILEHVTVDLAVIGLPAADAQKAADILVNGGVKAILNLSQILLIVPEHVTVRNVDICSEIMALSYYCKTGKKTEL